MFVVRGLQFVARSFRPGRERNLTLIRVRPNLKFREILGGERSCAGSGRSANDEAAKNYIRVIVEEYEKRNVVSGEFCDERGYGQASRLLLNRSAITEGIRSLEELGQQDDEIKKLGEDEFAEYQKQLDKIDSDLFELLLENIGRENRTEILLEITTGVGGQEAALFAKNLYDMYLGYLDHLGFDSEIVHEDAIPGIGGLRHASIAITGNKALELFRHEGGVHRVQRIPATERSGRIHTSTVSVAVLPQPTEIDVELRDKDLRIETKNASGAGGQHVNTTDSAVRITHLPTGMSVEAQTERSQIKNRKIAMMRLRTKIYEKKLTAQRATSDDLRKRQFGLGQRNEKIRTYNFNQDRITDHRIPNGTMHNLKGFMEGGPVLLELQERLQKQLQMKLLEEAMEKARKKK